METLLSPTEGLTLLILFGVVMIGLVWRRSRGQSHADGFLVADRGIGMWRGSLSIAVSWIWAPAIFVCSLQSYTKGLPGIFWFTLPNIVCFFIFAPFAIKLRRKMPQGYTFAEYISIRFPNFKNAHVAFLILLLTVQISAIVNNSVAGGYLLNALCGISISQAIILMAVIALLYSLMSGLKASVFTDVIQMSMVLIFAFVLIPWAIFSSGGISNVTNGFAGIDGQHGNILDPAVAFAMGIPMTISLLSFPFVDQMFFQRAWAVKEKVVVKSFVYAGLIFGLVPITLSLLGFLGVTLSQTAGLTVNDPQMVGPLVIGELLPKGALYLFCLMAFAGLCSTMDSAYCAGSSLGAIDIYRKYFKRNASDKEILRISRFFMLGISLLGTGIALLKPDILWVFFIGGAISAAGVVPVMLAITWGKLKARGVFWGIILSLLIGTPFSIYANVTENVTLNVYAAILCVSISAITCVVLSLKK